jgi:hypothetical protein
MWSVVCYFFQSFKEIFHSIKLQTTLFILHQFKLINFQISKQKTILAFSKRAKNIEQKNKTTKNSPFKDH